MTQIEAAGLITGLFVLMFAVLKGNVGRVRVKTKTDLGDGGNDAMVRAIRAQGNAVEDVPIFLIGLWALAFLQAPTALVLGFGVFFLIARILHALGLGGMSGMGFGRLVGTIMSVFGTFAMAGCVIYFALT